MSSTNLVLWAAGLGLQSLLLVILFRRGRVRRFPVFSFLVAFYVFRSSLLYILSSIQGAGEHGTLYDVLSTIDLLVQTLLVIEIAIRTSSREEGGHQRRWGRTALQLAVEGTVAAVIAMLLPEPMRVPVDRGIVLVTLLMIARLAWTVRDHVPGIPRAISGGFAVYGAVVTGMTYVQNQAVETRNSALFAVGSYTKASVYLGIVVFWVLSMGRRSGDDSQALSRHRPAVSTKASSAGKTLARP